MFGSDKDKRNRAYTVRGVKTGSPSLLGALCDSVSSKHRVEMLVETKKPTLFGTKRVLQEKTVWVDDRTYRQLRRTEKESRKAHSARPYGFLEMMFYDDLFGD